MSARNWIGGSAAALPGADIVIKALPVPVDYALLVKLPAALLCVALAYIVSTSKVKSRPVLYITSGILFLFLYIILSKLLLHTNPTYYRPGDNSLIGLWLSEAGRADLVRSGGSRNALEEGYSPSEWSILYSQSSQLASASLLAVVYALGLCGITVGFGRLLKR